MFFKVREPIRKKPLTRWFHDLFRLFLASLIVLVFTFIPAKAQTPEDPSSRIYRSASELDYPPFSVAQEDGSAGGFAVDLLKAAMEAVGLRVNITVGPWHEIKHHLMEGEVDVLPLVAKNQARDEIFDFTVTYLKMRGVVFVRKGNERISSLSDLHDKEVLVMRGDFIHECGVKKKLTSSFVETESVGEALKLLSSGQHDAVISGMLVGLQLINQMKLTNIEQANVQIEGCDREFGFAVKEGNSELLAELNDGLAIIVADGTYKEIYDKWFGIFFPHYGPSVWDIMKYAALFLVPMLLLVAIIGIWYLRKEVARRTTDLKQEITERRQAEDALRENKEILNLTLDATSDGAWDWNIATGEILYSDRWIQSLGYTRDEAEAHISFWESLVHPEDMPKVQKALAEHFEGKTEYFQCENRLRKKSGEYRENLDRGKVVQWDADGKPLRMVGTDTDITIRKGAEEKLRHLSLLNELILHSAGEGIYGLDLEGKTTFANPAAAQMIAWEPKDLLGKNQHDVLHHSHADGTPYPREDCPIYAAFKDGKIHHVDNEVFWRKDGASFPVEYVSTPIKNKQGEVIGSVVIFRDITERKKAEEELLRAKEKAENATKLKDKFLSLVSHDLRSPFASIKGFTRLILNDTKHPLCPQHREIMERIGESTGRMITMIEELLQISRLQTGKIVPQSVFIDGSQLASFAMGHLSQLAKTKGIEMINEVPPGTRLFADPHLFGQVLLNLASNAVKFCEQGDRVTFFVPPEKETTIAVKDTGRGMNGYFLLNLFSHEVKTSSAGTQGERGTGLGLPLSHDIMQALGGTLRAESKEGEGSTFYAELPYVKPRILVVDDDEVTRVFIKNQLKNFDADISEAENGKEALSLMNEKPPHLIITDLSMPVMDGFELLEKIQDVPEFKSVARIVITSFETIQNRERVVQIGANDFVSKPIMEEDFISRVRRFVI